MSVDPFPASFLDTNILVYALADDDPSRSRIAQELVKELMSSKALHTSTQVLQELYVTLTRKIRTPFTPDQALRYLDQIAAWPVMILDYEAVRTAVMVSSSKSFSFWDALVIVAAARSGSKRLYTEDLQDGQIILGVEVINPFRGDAA